VNFKNTIVIMTSNLGSQFIVERGLGWEDIRNRVIELVRTHFRPELLNRIDEIVVFRPLAIEQIEQIVSIQLRSLRKRLAERQITLDVTPNALQHLASEGFDPIYGARPLKRVIQKQIVQPLALRLLQGDFKDGDTVVVDSANGELTFSRRVAAAVA